mmetsp:Transcript_30303/g.76240  ORF Transcript_30303/g.76240 Transcript_30303/m.76240 type:complete len:225 (+) Transcript_30303:435-1109(+)
MLEVPELVLHHLPGAGAGLLLPVDLARGLGPLLVDNVGAALPLHRLLDGSPRADEPPDVGGLDGVPVHGVQLHDILRHRPRLCPLVPQALHNHIPVVLEEEPRAALRLDVLHRLALDANQRPVVVLPHAKDLLPVPPVDAVDLEPPLAHPVSVHAQRSVHTRHLAERHHAPPARLVIPRPVDHLDALDLAAPRKEPLSNHLLRLPREPPHENTALVGVGRLKQN